MEQLSAGLYVMAIGMTIVFGALIIIMLVMMALERIFREGGGADEGVVATAMPTTGIPGGEPTSTAEAAGDAATDAAPGSATGTQLAAAIAIAFARARARAGAVYPASRLPASLDNVEDDRWDWVWEEGVDDYGTTRYSHYAGV